ncbi:MAG: hypothetical protein PUF80_08790, partial [Firmicutes bacterium]|nr:hypothetical protein [Bacillota bacterium]
HISGWHISPSIRNLRIFDFNQIQKFKFKEITTMTKLTLEQQELLFANDCKLINLRYEYHGYTGTEKWAIVTELAEEELWVKYPDVIRRYTPFILLSMAQGEVIDESYRNNDKYEKRAKRTIDVYGYEDDISEQFHRELITPFVDPFEQAEEERIEEEKEQLRQLEIAKVRKVLEMLKPVQRERLIKAILLGMSSRKIAKEEGVYYSVVDKSIAAARKNFKKFYENL